MDQLKKGGWYLASYCCMLYYMGLSMGVECEYVSRCWILASLNLKTWGFKRKWISTIGAIT